MRLIIAGGRHYEFTEEDIRALDCLKDEVSEVLVGGASGADWEGECWARSRGIPVTVHRARWNHHGRAAGPIRNREMARQADAVVLFPGGKGTADMRRHAEDFGLIIYDLIKSHSAS